MSTSKEYKAVRNYILNELHLTKEDIIKNIEPLLEKLVKRCMLNTYGGNNQIEHWIRCMVTDELKQRDHNFVRRACESVIRDHVLNELNIIVRSKSEKCTCENRVPSEEDKKKSTDGLYIIYKDGHVEPFTGDNSKDCVRYIGLKHRYMSFAISLTEHDSVQLLDDDSREKSGSETYYERKCDALFDIDGRGNTERLVARNPKLKNLLKDGEYIPSLGQLNLMAHYMDELNKAFAYVSASFPPIFDDDDDDKVLDGIDISSDYAGKVFRLLPSAEMNRDSVLKNISNLDLYVNNIRRSYGEKVVLSLESLFNLMFGQKDYTFPIQDLVEYKKKSNAFWIKRIDNLLKYYERNRITLTESSFEYTVLMDEPDRNLDIDNIMQIYNVLSFHKPQTQIIAIVHNPALIYKLSKLDCVNFIEMTEGYLNKTCTFVSN